MKKRFCLLAENRRNLSHESEAEGLVVLPGKAVIAGKAVVLVNAVAEIIRHAVLKIHQQIEFVIAGGFDVYPCLLYTSRCV